MPFIIPPTQPTTTPVGPYVPPTFDTPVVSSSATVLTRRVPYVSPSEYKAAPTAVNTGSLVPGAAQSIEMSELANVLLRASDWVDLFCFHGPDGTLAASPTVQSAWVTSKREGVGLICNFKPILAVTGVALGPGPSNLTALTDQDAQQISVDDIIIRLGQRRLFGPGLNAHGRQYAVWSYISGYPHMSLAMDAGAGDMQIVVEPGVPGAEGITPYGVYPGTQLTIRDATGGTEVVMVASADGVLVTLTAPLQNDHTVPDQPDYIYVTALPDAVEQATISLTSCLIKLRGSTAMVMAGQPGNTPTKQAADSVGGLGDLETAERLLMPFRTVYRA